MQHTTLEEYQEMTRSRHKYNNKPVVDEGMRFDSKKEYARWRELLLLQKAGEISRLERQKKFELQPAFEHNGKKYRAVNYYADFYYYDNTEDRRHCNGSKSRWVIEDVKSPITRKNQVYQLKRKRMLFLGNEIKEI